MKIIGNIIKLFDTRSVFTDFLTKKTDLDQGRYLWANYKKMNKNGNASSEKKYSKNDIKLMMLAIDEENDLLKSYRYNSEE